jgi:hypothetical protein
MRRWNVERTCTTALEGAWVSYYDKVTYVSFRTTKLGFYAHVVHQLYESTQMLWAIGGRLA